LWDLTHPADPSLMATLTGPGNGVLEVAFSPDGHTLVAGGHDHTVRLWNIDVDAAWICSVAGQPITQREWNQYIPSRSYDPPCK
jgi:WD40 repeat protein